MVAECDAMGLVLAASQGQSCHGLDYHYLKALRCVRQISWRSIGGARALNLSFRISQVTKTTLLPRLFCQHDLTINDKANRAVQSGL